MPKGKAKGRAGRRKVKLIPRSREIDEAVHRMSKVIYPTKPAADSKKHKTVPSKAIGLSIAASPAENRIKILAKRFVRTYYEIFDRPGRANLEALYSSDAFFTFSSTYPMPTVGRNLLEVREPALRLGMLVHDKTNIAQALATFSPTEHVTSLLSIDVPYYISNPMSISSMQLVVTGVFRDTSQATNNLRSFTRVFVIKHTSTDNQGEPVYEIFNDLFMLQAPTADQIKKYNQETQKKSSLKDVQQNEPVVTNENLATISQKSMVRSIMSRTRMNEIGATRLLQDCGWNEEESMVVFNQLYPINKIPQEFFTPFTFK